ncbi:MAG: hypothetical protein HY820_03840 [Acidobacteria bacterium]|nr:hypothetical protein [Acidobacteriota bacterium]
MKRSVLLLVLEMVACCLLNCSRPAEPPELAKRLADPLAQTAAVKEVVAAPADRLPMLLRWTTQPPDMYPLEPLFVGLADVFWELRTVEAIDFLIKNVALERSNKSNVWNKADSVVVFNFPAAAALIRIGTPACEPLRIAYDQWAWKHFERRPLLFAISRIRCKNDFRAVRTFILGDLENELITLKSGMRLNKEEE